MSDELKYESAEQDPRYIELFEKLATPMEMNEAYYDIIDAMDEIEMEYDRRDRGARKDDSARGYLIVDSEGNYVRGHR